MAQFARSGFVWHELMTPDLEAAQRFYQAVTGLAVTAGPYPMLVDGTQWTGGLVGPRPEGPSWPSGGPAAHWIAYFGVADVEKAVQQAQELGGKVLLPPTDVPGFGRAAVLRDPQGAAFGVFTPAS